MKLPSVCRIRFPTRSIIEESLRRPAGRSSDLIRLSSSLLPAEDGTDLRSRLTLRLSGTSRIATVTPIAERAMETPMMTMVAMSTILFLSLVQMLAEQPRAVFFVYGQRVALTRSSGSCGQLVL